MGNESGKSIVILIIMTVLVIIGVSVVINYTKDMVSETKVQDLKTNMLLIQAEAKKGLENVCIQTVNLDENKENDLTKINESKQNNLCGIKLTDAPENVQNAVKKISNFTIDDNCYYLDNEILNSIGIKKLENEHGYFIVKYDFKNTNVEVINTSGYNGIYTLTQFNQKITGGQS